MMSMKNMYDSAVFDISPENIDFSIKIIKTAKIKAIGEIFPELSHVNAFYLLNDAESRDKSSFINISIMGIEYPLDLMDKTVIVLCEKKGKYHEKLFLCENDRRKIAIFESWLKDFSEKSVLHDRASEKFYNKDSKEYKEYFKKLEKLNDQ